MSNFLKNSTLGRKLGPKGLYITLGACLIALGGAGVAAYNKTVSDINDSLVIEQPEGEQQADNKKTDVEKEESSLGDVSSSQADNSSDNALDIQTQPNVMPVNGEILNPFSNGELVKDETLGVWKTHDGVDIKADVGTQVKAMNKGKVTKVWEDALWGNCITIDHGSGVIGHYYSLSKAMNVTEGDEVNAGEVIGSVGDTAECEAAELSHLHFGLKKNGEWIDPIEFIKGSSSK
ncbi:MAG: M23 family metallopeptidase [Ruminococcus sp.]|nr:M23 family metallopeptidase [Ruminococcus sp.]